MSFPSLLVGVLSLLSTSVFAFPTPPIHLGIPVNGTVVYPGGVNDLLVVKNTTVNATAPAGDAFAPDSPPPTYLRLQLKNYFNGNNVKAYVTGKNANGQLVFVTPNSQWYYPSTSSAAPVPLSDAAVAIPLGGKGSTLSVTIPGYLSSSRVWFSDGPLKFYVVATPNGPGLVEPAAVNPNDPNAATNYGFVELTWNGGLFANIGNVDFIGLPVGMTMTTTDNTPIQEALGLPSNAVQSVCSALQSQSKLDGQPWNTECVYTASGRLLRVLAPPLSISQDASRWHGYFDKYVNQVLQTYSAQPLWINTQAAPGVISCHANPSTRQISCNTDNRPYTAPTAADIFGCNSGPFALQAGDSATHYAVVPRICAAFNRGTFAGATMQPGAAARTFYASPVYNYYSRFVHEYEWKGLGYAFSYDDVTADGEANVAGVVASGNPGVLTLMVGGYDQA